MSWIRYLRFSDGLKTAEAIEFCIRPQATDGYFTGCLATTRRLHSDIQGKQSIVELTLKSEWFYAGNSASYPILLHVASIHEQRITLEPDVLT